MLADAQRYSGGAAQQPFIGENMFPQSISKEGIELIKKFEGLHKVGDDGQSIHIAAQQANGQFRGATSKASAAE